MDESTIFRQFIVLLINATGIALILTINISRVRSILKYIFTGMTLLMFIWVDFAYIARVTDQTQFALSSIRIAWAITPLLFVLVFSFFVHYFEITKKYHTVSNIFYAIGLIYMYLTLYTDVFVRDIAYLNGDLQIVYGTFIWFFFGIVGLFSTICVTILLQQYKRMRVSSKKAVRVRYLLIGFAFFFGANAIFNIILPVFFTIVDQYEFGDYSTIVFLAIVAYATVQQKLFGGRVVFTTFIASYLGSFLLANAIILSKTIEQRILSTGAFLLFIPIGYLLVRSILKEITYREQLEHINTALERSEKRYHDLAREQKDIIDVMGHEIRTPLTAIVQELQLHKKITFPQKEAIVHSNLPRDKAQSLLTMIFETLEIADKASNQAILLVKNMLETARLDKKTFELEYTEFNLIEEVQSSIQVMQKTVESDTYQIHLHTHGWKKLMIRADRIRIGEAVYGLLSNALKYGKSEEKKLIIDVDVHIQGKMVVVSVSDNGTGIAPEDIAKLGHKFVRLHNTMKGNVKRPGGTGLGLFVIKGVVEKHKGKLEIESAGLGKGAIFRLILPKGV